MDTLVKIMELTKENLLDTNKPYQEGEETKEFTYSFQKSSEKVLSIYYLLEIFDIMIDSPEKHPLLQEFFYFLFIDNRQIFDWIQDYTAHLLTSEEVQKEKIIRVIKHWSSLIDLIKYFKEEYMEATKKMMDDDDEFPRRNSIYSGFLSRFEFLVNPSDGLLFRYLTEEQKTCSFALKMEILCFLQKIFSIPNSPFLTMELYCNAYIRFHFYNFIKIYLNPKSDKKNIEECIGHLNVLLSFSQNKTPLVEERIEKLKIVQFLAKEFDLEQIYPAKKKEKAKEQKESSSETSESETESETESEVESEKSHTEEKEAEKVMVSKPSFSLKLVGIRPQNPDALMREQINNEIDPSRKNSEIDMNELNKLRLELGSLGIGSPQVGAKKEDLMKGLHGKLGSILKTGDESPNSDNNSKDHSQEHSQGHTTDEESQDEEPKMDLPPVKKSNPISFKLAIPGSDEENSKSPKKVGFKLPLPTDDMNPKSTGFKKDMDSEPHSMPLPKPIMKVPSLKFGEGTNKESPLGSPKMTSPKISPKSFVPSLKIGPGEEKKSVGFKVPNLKLGSEETSSPIEEKKTKMNVPSLNLSKEGSDQKVSLNEDTPSPVDEKPMKLPSLKIGVPSLKLGKSDEGSDKESPQQSPEGKPLGMKMPSLKLGKKDTEESEKKPEGFKMKMPPLKIGNGNPTEEPQEEVKETEKKPSLGFKLPSLKLNQTEESNESTNEQESPSTPKNPQPKVIPKFNLQIPSVKSPHKPSVREEISGEVQEDKEDTESSSSEDEIDQQSLSEPSQVVKPAFKMPTLSFKPDSYVDPDDEKPKDKPKPLPKPIPEENPEENFTDSEKEEDHDEEKYTSEHREALTQRNIFLHRKSVKGDMNDPEFVYLRERNNRKFYKDERLHVRLLTLLISIITTTKETLDSRYIDQYPVQRNMLNIPYCLHQHINHPSNEQVIPYLHSEVKKLGRGAMIFLKLICKKLFQSSLYQNKIKRIGVGAYGTVYKCKLPFEHAGISTVAAKMMEVPKSIHSRCVLHDIFSEILIMDQFKGDPRICRMYDFGVDDEFYYIIMKEYKCSLKNWREKQTTPLSQLLPLYMRIYYKVLEGVKFLSDNHVNHFDLKCDNIFLEPYEGVSEKDFWKNTTEDPNFKLVLGDFGEAHLFSTESDAYTIRHRGTDCIKSPEMLKIEMLKSSNKNYDRRKRIGANSASDVWSMGCLFYELLTTEFLFNTSNFFLVVTQEKFKLISQERFMLLNYNNILMDILTFILVRDPERRPSIDDLVNRWPQFLSIIPTYEEMKKKGKFLGIDSPKLSSREEEKKVDPDEYNVDLYGLQTPQVVDDHEEHLEVETYPWSSSDVDFYTTNVTEVIKNRLYLGSDKFGLDKNALNKIGITHVIAFSTSDQLYDDRFFYYKFTKLKTSEIPSDQNSFNDYVEAFKFIRNAIATKGKVFVFSGKGLSRAALFVISYLLFTYNLSSYEAYLYLKSLRPGIRSEIVYQYMNYLLKAKFPPTPSHSYPSMLKSSEKVKKWIGKVGGIDSKKFTFQIRKHLKWYRCLCGACLIGVSGKCIESSNIPKTGNYVVSNLKDLWPSFLEEMKAVYFYDSPSVEFAMTMKERCFTDEFNLSENVEKYVRKLGSKKKFVNSDWSLYRCKYCSWALYAVKDKSGKQKERPLSEVPPLDDVDIAIVSNLLSNLHITIEDKVEDMRPSALLSHFE